MPTYTEFPTVPLSYQYGEADPVDHADLSGRFDLTQFGIGAFETLSGLADIGVGITVGTLTSETVIGPYLGGVIASGGVLETYIGSNDVAESFD